ncbi:hypothetical protein OROMI_010399 [Orobanche minor]
MFNPSGLGTGMPPSSSGSNPNAITRAKRGKDPTLLDPCAKGYTLMVSPLNRRATAKEVKEVFLSDIWFRHICLSY